MKSSDNSQTPLKYPIFPSQLSTALQFLSPNTSLNVTYDHRLKRIRHPIQPAIHKLVIQWLFALNRANRHSVESKPLAASRVILG